MQNRTCTRYVIEFPLIFKKTYKCVDLWKVWIVVETEQLQTSTIGIHLTFKGHDNVITTVQHFHATLGKKDVSEMAYKIVLVV